MDLAVCYSAAVRQDETEDIYVGDTRVLLDLVVWSWQNGETPEASVQSYPALKLPDVSPMEALGAVPVGPTVAQR